MISVITACYNSEKTIRRAIESIISQSDNEFEHIIIDGASKDGTCDIIESYRAVYASNNIKLTIVSEPDRGLYDALNKGIALASGEYIGILNADDWYERDTIKKVNNAIRMNPMVDIIMGASTTINGNTVSVKKVKKSKIITSRNFNHGAMFVSKKCYNKVGLYANDGNYYDDFVWYVKAIKQKRTLLIMDDILYNFNCGGMSTIKSFKEVKKRIRFRYMAYRKNQCSRMYIIECILMEFAKWLLVK